MLRDLRKSIKREIASKYSKLTLELFLKFQIKRKESKKPIWNHKKKLCFIGIEHLLLFMEKWIEKK